jgi:hypothetical protein
MVAGRRFWVSLTEAEVVAMMVALSEYIYLLEEGDVTEAMEESDLSGSSALLTALEAHELKKRLAELL